MVIATMMVSSKTIMTAMVVRIAMDVVVEDMVVRPSEDIDMPMSSRNASPPKLLTKRIHHSLCNHKNKKEIL